MPVASFTKAGTKATTAPKLDKSIFSVTVTNHDLLKSAYLAYLANGRTSAANSKTRGEVSGGSKKPWKQKGTGRARFGSSRNPIWRGGGIAFGPTGNENYSHKVNVSAKRQALRQALSLSVKENKLIILEDLAIKESKTSEAVKLLNKIGAVKTVLLVVSDKTTETCRAFKNLRDVKLVTSKYINVYDSMNADTIIITNDALKEVNEWLSRSTAKTSKEVSGEQK